jgi:hypothetical protein
MEIDSRAEPGDWFSRGELPPWKLRKTKFAQAAGLSLMALGRATRWIFVGVKVR